MEVEGVLCETKKRAKSDEHHTGKSCEKEKKVRQTLQTPQATVHSPPVGLVWHSRQSSLRLPRQIEHVSLSTSHDHMNTGLHFLISNGDLPDGFAGSAGAAAAGAAAAAAGAAADPSVIALWSVIVVVTEV